MSSTRYAKEGSPLRQERWSSSPAYDRGLLAHLVADRCSKLGSAADREVIWLLQALSWRESRASGIAQEILAKHGDRIGTRTMRGLRLKPRHTCKLDTVRRIREELRIDPRKADFLLRGEFTELEQLHLRAEYDDCERLANNAREASQQRPTSFPASEFIEYCRRAALFNLDKYLSELCLNPESDLSCGPRYFVELPEVLREFKAAFERESSASVAVTSAGKRVYEALDYTRDAGCFTMIYGNCGRGKSFAARAWCAARPGAARFCEVPASNDDHSFFLALAEVLGVSANIKQKAFELRERIEQAVVGSGLMLCLDEAARLWPLKNLRDNTPSRVAWLMSLVDRDVPVALVVTPQFFANKDRVQQSCGWNSDQFFRRFRHIEDVPDLITADDIRVVCDSLLPGAGAELSAAIVTAIQSQKLPQPLDTLDMIAKRAGVLAAKAGAPQPDNEHVAESFQFALRSQSTLARLTAPKKGRAALPDCAPVAATPLPSRGRVAAMPPRVSVLEFPDRSSTDKALAKSG